MPDNLQTLYNNLVKEGYELPTYDQFKLDMSDPEKSQKLHGNLKTDGYDLPDYEVFLEDMGLSKKKVPSLLGATSKAIQGNGDFLEALGLKLKSSSTPKQPYPSGSKKEPTPTKPTDYTEVLPQDLTLGSIVKARKKEGDYLMGEAEAIQNAAAERIKTEISATQKALGLPDMETKLNKMSVDIDAAEQKLNSQETITQEEADIFNKQVKEYNDLFKEYQNKASSFESGQGDIIELRTAETEKAVENLE